MSGKILNITNGDAFNRYFLSEFGGDAIPFCEAMMDGDTVYEIYSNDFTSLRASELGVSADEYVSKAHLSKFSALREYPRLNLWFGKDTFCQMNLLTLLAYLEQVDYRGKVLLNYIDDETFSVIEANISVELGSYNDIYKKILILKENPGEIGVLVRKAVELYFDYHSNNGMLARSVRENSEMNDGELLRLLLEISAEYGLSDIQAQKLIEKYKEK